MFLARTDEQRRFEAALREARESKADPGASQVFVLHGLGGMGKTELCQRFYAIARGELDSAALNAKKYVVVAVNWQEERENHGVVPGGAISAQPRDVLAILHDAVISNSDVLENRRLEKRSARAFESYRRTLANLPELQSRGGGTAAEIDADTLSAVLSEGLKTAGDAGAALTGNPIPSSAGRGLARAARAVRQKSRNGDLDPETVQIALRPAAAMTREFAKGLREMSGMRPVVMILDTYEIVASGGGWIRQVMRASGGRVLWVVAARLESEEEAGSTGELASFRREIPENRLRTIAMSRFDRRTIAEELAQRGAPGAEDAGTLDLVASVTRGVPLAVGIVAGMLAQGEGMEEIGRSINSTGDTSRLVRELTERYLLHALDDPELSGDIPRLYGLALLYSDRTDSDLLQALWGPGVEVASTLSDLAHRHDFVLTGSRRLHQDVRDVFRRYLLDDARRAAQRDANRRAAAVAEDRLAALITGNSLTEYFENEAWQAAAANYAWHRFWVGNEEGLDAICGLLPAAILLQRSFAHELIGIATFFSETFTPEQGVLIDGLTALLSFGGFLDAWFEKRNTTFGGASGETPHGTENVGGSRLAALRAMAERSAEDQTLPIEPIKLGIMELLTAKVTGAADPDGALVALLNAAGKLGKGSKALDAAIAETAAALAAQLIPVARDATPSPDGIRAARLRVEYDRDSVGAWFDLAWGYNRIGEIATATAKYDEVVTRFGGESDLESRRLVARAIGNKIICLGNEQADYQPDLKALKERFAGDEDPLVRRELARAMQREAADLGRQGDPEAGLRACQELLDRFGADEWQSDVGSTVAGTLIGKAGYLTKLKDRSSAIAAYGEVLDRFGDSDDPEQRFHVARSLLYQAVLWRAEGQPNRPVELLDLLLEREADTEALKKIRIIGIIQHLKSVRSASSDDVPDPDRVEAEVDRLLGEIDAPGADVLGTYAVFVKQERDHPDRVRSLFEAGLEAEPENPSLIANFAQFLFERGELEEAYSRAYELVNAPSVEPPDALLEVSFYLFALGPPDRRSDALGEVRRLLLEGVRSPDWPLDGILARAEAENREEMPWLRRMAAVIGDSETTGYLAGWSAWEEAGAADGSPA